ncbi:MAG: histidine ammonia-lyase [Phycisphaerae bacterium]
MSASNQHARAAATTVRLDGSHLTFDLLDEIYERPIRVEIADNVWQRIDASRQVVERIAAGDQAVYGVNTGFGHLCGKRINANDLDKLQHNVVRSHAVGVGPSAPDAVVRLMLLFKIHGLALGYSGIRRDTVCCLQAMLNHDVLPVVPDKGSLGASGDLAPLAHLVIPLIGEGDVRQNGEERPAAQAFAEAGIETVRLGAKEGLALINGTQFMSAYAAAILVRARRVARQADVIASMSLEALRGSLKPFDARLHQLRPHPGAIDVADNFRTLMADSEILASHIDCDRVQDPYSLRCIPQVHGASRDVISHTSGIVECEINSVTDNPLIFDDGTAISGGNFHGQPLALALDYLAIGLSELGSISERRIYLLLNGHDELPALLMRDTGLNSGFMLPQYTAAALVSENKLLASPASVDSIPTSLGQEDHVSMGAIAATKCWQVMNNLETVLAIEQMCAAQALDYRLPLKPGVGPRIAHQVVRQHITHTEQDRLFKDDIEASLAILRAQHVLKAIEKGLGSLK